MNKLIPLFILPCTLALYVFDFYFCKPHPASQMEVTTATGRTDAASTAEIPTEAVHTPDKVPDIPVKEATTDAEDATDTILYTPSDLIAEINVSRSSYGLSALSEDSQLHNAAAVRCNELLVSMSHTRPDGRSCSTVYAELGIYPSVWGENLAAGYGTAAGTASDWMSSDGHRANILNPSFTKCGVAHITCNYGYYDYWVILFSD